MRLTWTAEDIHTLREMWLDGFMPEEIGAKLNKTVVAIESKAQRMHLSANVPARKKVFALPPLDTCTWLDGEKPNYVRCTRKVWNGSSWCYDHWKKTHAYGPRRQEEVL